MVKECYANTTIEQDLKTIEQAYLNIYNKVSDDLPIVNIIDKKPGLDDIDGKYIIEGAVVLGKISVRSKNSRSGDAYGYRVSRLLCDDLGNVIKDSLNKPTVVETKLVTKEQGIHLTQFMGSRNSYIRIHERKDSDGDVVKNTIHLRPFPARTQAFFLDGRVVKIYETDEYGDRVKPVKLTVSKEDCTHKMWAIIQNDYASKSKREKPKKSMLESRKENEKKMNNLKEMLIKTNSAVVNPFK